jgi:hypothetical protein
MKLTVILRNDAPVIHAQAAATYRTVQVQMTASQIEALRPRRIGGTGETTYYEDFQMAILELEDEEGA